MAFSLLSQSLAASLLSDLPGAKQPQYSENSSSTSYPSRLEPLHLASPLLVFLPTPFALRPGSGLPALPGLLFLVPANTGD